MTMVTSVRSWGEALSRAWRGPAAGRVFAIAGVVAAGVYVAGDVVSGLLYPGYSFRDQWISELTARGSPVRPVMLGVMTLHGLLGAGLALGIWRSAGGSRSLRPVGPLLVTAGAVGFYTHVVFPLSSRGMRPSFSDDPLRDRVPGMAPRLFDPDLCGDARLRDGVIDRHPGASRRTTRRGREPSSGSTPTR